MNGLLGMKVLETSMLPGDMVVMVRNGETMHRFIWTANALADQEKEIESLRAQLAAARHNLAESQAALDAEQRAHAQTRARLADLVADLARLAPPENDR